MNDRTVTTDALATLGTILDGSEKRDAIHIAVEPVKVSWSSRALNPGEHVYFNQFDGCRPAVTESHGIVDPYLTKPVQPGERFWLFIKPRTITELRHVWEHPDFPSSTEKDWEEDYDDGCRGCS